MGFSVGLGEQVRLAALAGCRGQRNRGQWCAVLVGSGWRPVSQEPLLCDL